MWTLLDILHCMHTDMGGEVWTLSVCTYIWKCLWKCTYMGAGELGVKVPMFWRAHAHEAHVRGHRLKRVVAGVWRADVILAKRHQSTKIWLALQVQQLWQCKHPDAKGPPLCCTKRT